MSNVKRYMESVSDSIGKGRCAPTSKIRYDGGSA